MEIQLIAVPYDSGVPDVRMGTGPARLIEGGLARHLEARGHRVHREEVRAPATDVSSEIATAFTLNGMLADAVRVSSEAGRLPVVLAGSCYSALGTVAGLSGGSLGVIWMDTHADLNTPETTASGFLDGMAISMLTGACFRTLAAQIRGHEPIPWAHLLLIGTRDVDPPEKLRITEETVAVLDPASRAGGLSQSLEDLRSKVPRVYVHVDLDVLDPDVARANTFVAPHGLSVEDLIATVTAIRDSFEIAAMGFTAYDPGVDPDGRVVDAVLALLGSVLES